MSLPPPPSESPAASPTSASELLSLDTKLACDCEQSGLVVEVSARDLLLLACPRCGYLLAGVPVLGEAGPAAVRRLVLSTEERAELAQALRITAAQPLASSLRGVLACSQPVALRVAQQRLSQRPEVLKELSQALYAPEPEARLLTLQLIARMPQPPAELQRSAVHAIQMLLGEELGSEAQCIALAALHPLAVLGHGVALRGELERIGHSAKNSEAPGAELSARLATAVLAAMQRAKEAAQARFATQRDTLLKLLRDGQIDAARTLLETAYPTSDPNDPDGGMTGRIALCEAAVEALQHAAELSAAAKEPLRQQLLTWALSAAEVFASWSTSGSEGLSRMVQVNKLRARLRRGK